jgi:hypothetical protein
MKPGVSKLPIVSLKVDGNLKGTHLDNQRLGTGYSTTHTALAMKGRRKVNPTDSAHHRGDLVFDQKKRHFSHVGFGYEITIH